MLPLYRQRLSSIYKYPAVAVAAAATAVAIQPVVAAFVLTPAATLAAALAPTTVAVLAPLYHQLLQPPIVAPAAAVAIILSCSNCGYRPSFAADAHTGEGRDWCRGVQREPC